MKKLLAIVLSIAMLACFAVVASAENEVVTMTVDTVNVDADGYALVPINGTVADGENVGALQFILKYDAEKLEIVKQQVNEGTEEDPDWVDYDVVGTSRVPSGTLLENNIVEPGSMKIALATTRGITKSGTWFTIKFKVTDKAAADEELVLGIEDVSASKNVEGGVETISAAATGGKIINTVPTPEPPVPSDGESKGEGPSKTESKTDDGKKPVPKTGDNSVVFFAVALCVAAAAAFVVTKKVND